MTFMAFVYSLRRVMCSLFFFTCVPGMAQFLRVKVPSRVFTAKCSEPQAENSNVQGEEVVQQSRRAYEQKPDKRLNDGQGCTTNQSPKGKRNVKTVNLEVVRRKNCVLPWEAWVAYISTCDKKLISRSQLGPQYPKAPMGEGSNVNILQIDVRKV